MATFGAPSSESNEPLFKDKGEAMAENRSRLVDINSMFGLDGFDVPSLKPQPAAQPTASVAPAPAPVAQAEPKSSAVDLNSMFGLDAFGPGTKETQTDVAPKEPGLNLGGSVAKGFKGLKVTWDFLANKLEKAVTGDGSSTDAILAKSAAEYQAMETDPRIAELVKKGDQAPDTFSAVKDMLGYALRNPTMVANFLAEQAPGMLVGGGIGAAASAPVKGAAVNLATKAGASAGVQAAVGTGVTGASVNASAVVFQSLGSNYVEGLSKYKGDTEAASDYAVTKTAAEVPTNAIAGAFLGLNPFKSKVANIANQANIQGIGGATGAYAAAKSVGEDPSRGEMLLEYLGEAASAPVDIAMEKLSARRKEQEQARAEETKNKWLAEGEQALAESEQAPPPDGMSNEEQRFRFRQLDAMARGADSITGPGPDGQQITTKIEARALTKDEMAEYEELKQKFQPEKAATPAAEAQPAAQPAVQENEQTTETQPVIANEVDKAAHEAATSPLNDKAEPTEAQKDTGNYSKGHVKIQGLNIAIENPQGSTRSGKAPDGTEWKTTMANHYGYIKGSIGKDKDHVDVFIGPNPSSGKVFVVDQVGTDGKFDEHKVMLGFDTSEEAAAAYKSNYSADWQGLGAISEMPVGAFKSWVKDGEKRKPLAYVQPKQDAATTTETKVEAATVQPEAQTQSAPAQPEQTAATAQEKTVTPQTVEQKLKAKQKAKVESGKTQKQAEAKAEPKKTVEQTMKEKAAAKAEEKKTPVSEKVVQQKAEEKKAQQAADKKIGKRKVSKEEAVEFWEDNDDGEAAHIAWRNLPREFQLDWKEAMEDGYASADLHDQLVKAAKQNERAAKANDKVAKAKQDTDIRDAYRLSETPKRGMLAAEVEKVWGAFKAAVSITPDVVIVQDETGLPVKMRNQIAKEGISGKVPGAFSNGKVYLIASNLNGAKDVMVTLTHEIAGHFGLRSILGENHTNVMESIYEGNAYVRKLADEMVKKEGLTKAAAVEEVLADIAEVGGDLKPEQKSALQKLIQAIRIWLRDNFDIKYVSDAEVKQIIAKARRYVVEGDVEAGPGGVAAADASTAMKAGTATFYSALQRAFRDAKAPAKMPASQWKSWLYSTDKDGNIVPKQPGVKAEEIEWTGIDEWLTLRGDDRLTKEQISEWVAANRVYVNEVILSGQNRKANYGDDAFVRIDDDLYYDADDVSEDNYIPSIDEMEELQAELAEQFGEPKQDTRTRHKGYTLKGGKNYAELVMFDPSDKVKPYNTDDETHYGDIGQGRAIGWLRMNIRKDKNGNSVLFIEELQSKRGQDMRGDESVPSAPFMKDTKSWTSLLIKRAIAYAQQEGVDRIAWTTGEQQNKRYDQTKHMDKLVVTKTPSGKWNVLGSKKGETQVEERNLSDKALADTLGKSIADEVIANGGIEMSKKDIEINQQDLRPYYNTTVPSVASAIIKKFGGSVEVMNLKGTGKQLGFVIPEGLQQMVEQDGLPMFRRRDAEAQFADLDEDTRSIIDKKFRPRPPTIKERLESYKPGLARRLVQGMFDPYRSIKDIDNKLYMKARMTTSIDGAVEGLVYYGQVYDDDGALNVKQGTKGLLETMKPLGNEVDRFLMWVAANRAAELKKEDREKLFTDDDLKKLKALNLNKMADGRARTAVYAEVLRGMNEINRSVLDVSKDAGLIDQKAYERFASDVWYVPFYRNMDDEKGLSGMMTAASLTGQEFSKALKGSDRALNDLMHNVLMNWSHILSASMKNKAARETLDAAAKLGDIVTEAPADSKYAVKVMVDGKPKYYYVEDEFLLDSLTSVTSWQGSNWFLDRARSFKTTFTKLISLNPTFKINNLIRDSIQAVGISDLKGNFVMNAIEGYRAYKDDRMEALVGGGLFTMGNAFDGERSEAVKRLVAKGVKDEDIINTPEKAKKLLHSLWDKYDEISDAAENANRLSLYKQLRDSGATHLEAAFAARDLQDFSLRGSFGAIRYLTQIVPYMNARMQGMYKLGRAGLENPRKFGVVAGAVSLAGLALYLGQMDDEDWKKREEWDRDMFFWFKIGDRAIRIPKPFEMGAIATFVERVTEQIVDKDVEGKVFRQRMMALLADNFGMNLMPQVFRPIWDIARNKDGFTDRPIESMGMQHLSAANRVNPGTSGVAMALGNVNSLVADGLSAVTGVSKDKFSLSPIQIDYAIRGYLGWLGTVIQTSSVLAADAMKEGETHRWKKVDDFFVVGNFVKSMPQTQSKYVSAFYQNAKEFAEVQADFNHMLKAGKIREAIEIQKDNAPKMALAKLYAEAQRNMAAVSEQITLISDSKTMTGEQKRQAMDRLTIMRGEYAKAVEMARKRMGQ